MLLSREAFLKFYHYKMNLALSHGHYEELRAMYKLYKESKTDEEFTQLMTNAGYGKLN